VRRAGRDLLLLPGGEPGQLLVQGGLRDVPVLRRRLGAHDWREGTPQHAFIERCLSTVDRKHQPWLVFAAHRVLGYSSNDWYAMEGAFEEPEGRESLQRLWQKYRVDIAFFGHVHNYERTCPVYQVIKRRILKELDYNLI